jgi:hypothetical protein
LSRVCLARFVPPSGFWLPSWRFTPPGSAPALFHAGSAPGIPPFGAFPSRKVSRWFPSGMDPHAVSLAAAPAGEPAGRNDKPRLLGFDPSGSPLPSPARLTRERPDAPLGFSPFQGLLPNALPMFPMGSSHALGSCSSANCSSTRTSEYPKRPTRPTLPNGPATRKGQATLLGFPHRFAPDARTAKDSGYGFTSRRHAHH